MMDKAEAQNILAQVNATPTTDFHDLSKEDRWLLFDLAHNKNWNHPKRLHGWKARLFFDYVVEVANTDSAPSPKS
jgi:hypothetical protein